MQDDSRKYPGKEAAGPMAGATGGFRGGELGVQQFTAGGSLNLADPAEVRQRQQTKDVLLLVGLAVLGAASFAGLQYLGLVALPEAAGVDVVAATAEGAAAAPRAAPQLQLPAVSKEVLVGGAAAAGLAGAVAAVGAAKEGAAEAAAGLAQGAQQNAARLVVLGGAGGVAYLLLQS